MRLNNPEIKFLVFSFYREFNKKAYQAKPNKTSAEKFRHKLKLPTRENWSINTKYQIERLNQVIRGWINYYKIGSMKTSLIKINSHLRVRHRMCIWHK